MRCLPPFPHLFASHGARHVVISAIDDPTNENVKKLVIKNGTHNDAIHTYTGDERKQLMDFVKSILFPASATK